jgi:outer membrane protein insertion porin family
MYRFFLLSFFFSAAFGVKGFSQETSFSSLPVIDYSSPKEYEVAEIVVSGVQFLDTKVLASMTGLSVGQKITIPGDDITKIVTKFWEQGLFSDVKITASKIEGNKIYLDVYMKERPRLSQFNLTGLKKTEKQDLEEKLKIRTGTQVTENVINNMVNTIRKHFTEKGFHNIDIKVEEIPDASLPNRVILNVEVDKNSKVKVVQIVFEGNENFTDRRLRRTMKKTKQKDLNFFKSAKYIENEFREDRKKLIEFYNEQGYRDAKIISDSVVYVTADRLALFIQLHEGEKYHFGNITWVGNTKYPAEILNKALGIKKGDVFDQTFLEKRLFVDEDAVNSIYLDDGYLFFSLTPVELAIRNDTIDLEMRVYEGKQATINKVIISGNTKTNEHVIRREIRTRPGQLFSKSDIIRTVRELATLGHFDPEKIEPSPIPNPADGTVDIEYKLVEKANDQLEVSGGWGAGMLVGTVGVRFSNFSAGNLFNAKAWRPIPSGDGQTLSLRAQSNGTYYKAYSMTFMEPWFGGKKPNSFTFSLYHTVQSGAYRVWEKSDKSFKVSGASIGLGKRLKWPDDFFQFYNEVGFQDYNLKNWYRDYFGFEDGRSHILSYRISLSRNSQDQPIYPRRGSSFSLTLQLTPPYSSFKKDRFWELDADERANKTAADIFMVERAARYKWIEYHKWTYKGAWFTRLVGNLVLSVNTQFGYLGHYNKPLGPSPFEGFDLGGDGLSGYNLYGRETIGLRGYTNNSLTPLKADGSKAGNIYEKLAMELRYPITLSPSATIYGLTFVEAGNAWMDFKSFNPFTLRRSAGIGLRAFLPMFGLLGVDWGYGFDEVPGRTNVNGSQFHFVIGQQF